MNFFKNFINKKNNKKRRKKSKDVWEFKCAVSNCFNCETKEFEFYKNCNITDITKKKDVFCITLKRPGVFIGKGGCTINEIKNVSTVNMILN